MAIRNIIQLGDPTLRKRSFEVVDFGTKTHQLLDDMKETLVKADGVIDQLGTGLREVRGQFAIEERDRKDREHHQQEGKSGGRTAVRNKDRVPITNECEDSACRDSINGKK